MKLFCYSLFEGERKIVQNGQTEVGQGLKSHARPCPTMYKGTSRGEVCS